MRARISRRDAGCGNLGGRGRDDREHGQPGQTGDAAQGTSAPDPRLISRCPPVRLSRRRNPRLEEPGPPQTTQRHPDCALVDRLCLRGAHAPGDLGDRAAAIALAPHCCREWSEAVSAVPRAVVDHRLWSDLSHDQVWSHTREPAPASHMPRAASTAGRLDRTRRDLVARHPFPNRSACISAEL
jgi:hypothetical protein